MKRRWIWIGLLILAVADLFILNIFFRRWRENRHDEVIWSAAHRYNIPPELVKAVVWKESQFHSSARGKAGEFGLMQIREMAAQEWADFEKIEAFQPDNLMDPRTNTFAGTFYLSKLMKRYVHTDNPLPYALADYNAGRSNVLKWNQGAASTNSALFIEQVGFPSTQMYIRQVIKKYEEYTR